MAINRKAFQDGSLQLAKMWGHLSIHRTLVWHREQNGMGTCSGHKEQYPMYGML